jgi:hypothetical protein
MLPTAVDGNGTLGDGGSHNRLGRSGVYHEEAAPILPCL